MTSSIIGGWSEESSESSPDGSHDERLEGSRAIGARSAAI